MSKTNSNNSVLYLFVLSLLLSVGAVFIFSKDAQEKSKKSYRTDLESIAAAYIPIDFTASDVKIAYKTPEEVKKLEDKINASKKETKKPKEADKTILVKDDRRTSKAEPIPVYTPPPKKKSAVMSYAVTIKQPTIITKPVTKPVAPIIKTTPKTIKKDVSSLEKEIQAIAAKKLEREINAKKLEQEITAKKLEQEINATKKSEKPAPVKPKVEKTPAKDTTKKTPIKEKAPIKKEEPKKVDLDAIKKLEQEINAKRLEQEINNSMNKKKEQ